MTREDALEQECGMRDATKEESESVNNYIKSISKPTGINFYEQEPCDVFDEYGNYKYPSNVKLIKPNTATSMFCEDAISRQAVKDWFCTNYCSEHNKCEHFEKGDCNAMNELFAIKAVLTEGGDKK